MAKRIAPERPITELLSLRASMELLLRVDRHAEQLQRERPGEIVTRSEAARDILARHAPKLPTFRLKGAKKSTAKKTAKKTARKSASR